MRQLALTKGCVIHNATGAEDDCLFCLRVAWAAEKKRALRVLREFNAADEEP